MHRANQGTYVLGFIGSWYATKYLVTSCKFYIELEDPDDIVSDKFLNNFRIVIPITLLQ